MDHPCNTATNILKLVYNNNNNTGQKKQFGVCVKGLDFPDQDISHKLVEWIEILLVLGADTIFFYLFSVHKNVKKVFHRNDEFLKDYINSSSCPELLRVKGSSICDSYIPALLEP